MDEKMNDKLEEVENMEEVIDENKEKRPTPVEIIKARWEDLKYDVAQNGTVSGYIHALVGFASALLGTVIRNILFSQRDQFDMTNAAKQEINASKLKNKTESKETQKDQVINKEKTEEKTIPKDRTKEESKIKEEITPDIRDQVTNMMLKDKEIKEVFKNIGLLAQAEKNSDNIYLFAQDLKKANGYFDRRIFTMSKADLLVGDGKSLAVALYNEKLNRGATDMDKDRLKLHSAMVSSLAVASARYLGNKEEFKNSQLKGERMHLSKIQLETQAGATLLEVKGNPETLNEINFFYNGKNFASVSADVLTQDDCQTYFNELDDLLQKEYQKDLFKEFTIGNGNTAVCFAKNKDGETEVRLTGEKEKVLGTYKFESERDVRALAKLLSQEKAYIVANGKRLNNQSIAFTIGCISNPAMEPDRNKAGQVLNTFTGRPEPDGVAHMNLVHNEYGSKLYQCIPVQNNILNKEVKKWNKSSLEDKEFIKQLETNYNVSVKKVSNQFVAKGEKVNYHLHQSGNDVIMTEDNSKFSEMSQLVLGGKTSNGSLTDQDVCDLVKAVELTRQYMKESTLEVEDYERPSSVESDFVERDDYFESPMVGDQDKVTSIMKERNAEDIMEGLNVSFEIDSDYEEHESTINEDIQFVEYEM